ncbi:histidinol-phosphate transaminase [Streptomyces sp. ACA25]|uniref:histidinol-phosphate transaminase n=1 Tax=Streptomyces sp. ACA25 TaxID=3022596 RepID=UPI002307641D|nr:histidinol-phosphate transaminase [Streptomyces sp. ACA25]MDB1089745.1 histidinol-phosphate transaminase [Streptomyces sp. ACA25]
MSFPPLRSLLDALPAYEPSDGVYAGPTRPRLLSANESPHDPLPGIVEAIAAAGATVNRYPDPGCGALTLAIAEALGTDEDQVVVGAGSVALLQTLVQSISDPGAEAVYAWPSFELYPVLSKLAGVVSVPVPLSGAAHDLRAMADRITPSTRLVIICNPNNPTGSVVGSEDLGRFLAAVPPSCLVAIDEAYHEYVRAPQTSSGLRFCEGHPNVVVLRTFSKAYGLAGLRVGYLIGDARVVRRLRKVGLAYSVSAVAQRAAVAALGLEEQLLQRVGTTVAERSRVQDALLDDGWQIPESQANFLWLPLGEEAAGFGRWCASQGIAVRTFPGEGVRVSIGSTEDDDAFLAVASEWRRRPPAAQDPDREARRVRTAVDV